MPETKARTEEEIRDAAAEWSPVLCAALDFVRAHLPPGEGHGVAILIRNGRQRSGHMFMGQMSIADGMQALADLESNGGMQGQASAGEQHLEPVAPKVRQ